MNAKEFYAALAIAQREVYRSVDDFDLQKIRECGTVMLDEHLEPDWSAHRKENAK
jgi:hypothetical protein